MFKRRSKIETGLGAGKPADRILRLLSPDKGFAGSLDSLEGRDQENVFEGSWKEARNALLEGEFTKSQGLLRLQQNNPRCY